MARGGGVVAGSKHSASNDHDHEHYHSHGGGGSGNPFVTAIGCFIMGVIFLILTIVIPVVMVADPQGVLCTNAESVNRNEQMVCEPKDFDHKWVTQYKDENGKNYAKVYRTTTSALKQTYRTYQWDNYEADLKGTFDDFAFSVPVYQSGSISVFCDGSKCKKLKMWLMTHDQYKRAIDSNGEFNEKEVKKDFGDFRDGQTNYFDYVCEGPEYYHLVFSNRKSSHVVITYSIFMNSTIYSVDGLKPEECEGTKCKFVDLKKDDVLILDFLSSGNHGTPGRSSSEPEWVSATMHNTKISWGGIIAAIVICGLLTLIFFAFGALFIFKALKHH